MKWGALQGRLTRNINKPTGAEVGLSLPCPSPIREGYNTVHGISYTWRDSTTLGTGRRWRIPVDLV